MFCATIEVPSTEVGTFAIDPAKEFTLMHLNETKEGLEDKNTIWLAFGDEVPDGQIGLDKYRLKAFSSVCLGPGISILKFRSAAGIPIMALSLAARITSGYQV